MNNPFFQRLLAFGAISGTIGVIFGAFGAHFLKSRLPEGDLETIKTGVLYLFIHALAMVMVSAIAGQRSSSRWLKKAGICFMAGVVMFSGSLFIIGTASLTGFPVSAIGLITPIGGLFFILGWIFLSLEGSRK